MEIQYKITEDDYVAAWRMRRKQYEKLKYASVIKQLWLLAVYAFVIRLNFRMNVAPLGDGEAPRLYSEWGHTIQGVLLLAYLALVFVSCRIIVRLLFPTNQFRKRYARDLRMHYEILFRVTPEDYFIHYTFGQTSSSGWNVFKCWEQSGDLLLLYYPSNIFVIVKLTGLIEEQRDRLQKIIAGALPNRTEAK